MTVIMFLIKLLEGLPSRGKFHIALLIAIPCPVLSTGLVRKNGNPLLPFERAPPLRHPGHGLGPSGFLPSLVSELAFILSGAFTEMSFAPECVKRFHANKSNFSIDHILYVAGGKQNLESFQFSKEVVHEEKKFDWLNCTRYKPPKLPRHRKKEGITRRKLGRNPRIPFSSSQVAFLEAKFFRTPYLSSSDVTELATYLKLSETRVKIWFQNRRARERREKDIKSKLEENSIKSAVKLKSPPRSATFLPLDFSKCFALDCNDSFRHAACSQPANRFQTAAAPLDLSEPQMTCRSNDF